MTKEWKTYGVNDHDGVWPVGAASVVVAHSEEEARLLLDTALTERGLKTSDQEPYTLREVEPNTAVILLDGDY